ncbi:hypothetical protein [Kaistia sp. MMO-174]|uniref:hypothetical protein n=1 Tax=Kaistia sp. MMO-174 TaxID=3081256 RepID=UPI00301A47D6
MAMPPDPRTRAFARVIGPFVAIVSVIAVFRMPEITATAFLDAFFQNPVLVWIAGATLVLFGILILAQHPIWSSAPAVGISLFGWILLARGIALLTVPQAYERIVLTLANVTGLRIGAGLLAIIGIWLASVGWRTPPASRP